jgi:pimeloyl-ACP methyl ester carboxylesterase
MRIMFGKSFLSDPARAKERESWRDAIIANDRKGITRAAHAVIGREGVGQHLRDINVPTLIIVGEEDIATPPKEGRKLHEAIPGATLLIIPKAGHSSSIEQPKAVTQAIVKFIQISVLEASKKS